MTSSVEDLFSELIRYETELWAAIDARLRAEFDLPLSRFEPMQVIATTPNCRVYDIGDRLSVTTGGISKLVDRIEDAGHCMRLANPDDRRSSIIVLTPQGEELHTAASAVFHQELAWRVGAVLPGGRVDAFVRTLRRLRAANAAGSLHGTAPSFSPMRVIGPAQ